MGWGVIRCMRIRGAERFSSWDEGRYSYYDYFDTLLDATNYAIPNLAMRPSNCCIIFTDRINISSQYQPVLPLHESQT